MRARLLCCLIAALAARAAAAHEFWIEPDAHVVSRGDAMTATLRVGEDFAGQPIPYVPTYFESFTLTTRDGTDPVRGTLGQSPAFAARAETAGTAVVAYHSDPSLITFDEWEKFQSYLRYENNAWAIDRHRALGLPETGIREEFIRNAKTLIAVDDATGDRAIGLPFEVVALTTQAEAAATGSMEITLLWRGAPVAGQGFNLFRKNAMDNPLRLRTDSAGRARLPVSEPGRYLVNAVHLEADPGGDLHWRSHWASLTFAIAP